MIVDNDCWKMLNDGQTIAESSINDCWTIVEYCWMIVKRLLDNC